MLMLEKSFKYASDYKYFKSDLDIYSNVQKLWYVRQDSQIEQYELACALPKVQIEKT